MGLKNILKFTTMKNNENEFFIGCTSLTSFKNNFLNSEGKYHLVLHISHGNKKSLTKFFKIKCKIKY